VTQTKLEPQTPIFFFGTRINIKEKKMKHDWGDIKRTSMKKINEKNKRKQKNYYNRE
jgi:hypothetical protein